MKIVAIGDIFGKKGRFMLEKYLPEIRATYNPDFVIVNTDNIAHGKGVRSANIKWLSTLGVDIATNGDHVYHFREDVSYELDNPDTIQLRPGNYPTSLPGVGAKVFSKNGQKILVLNVLGTAFMRDHLQNPFTWVARTLIAYSNITQPVINDSDAEVIAFFQTLSRDAWSKYDAIVVDFHKETTSEGYAMAHFLDGKAELLYGTHTHVQTNDAEVFPKGLGFISDVGFTGARLSVIGVTWESICSRFFTGVNSGQMLPDETSLGVLSGVMVEILDKKAVDIVNIRLCEK